MQVLKHSIAYSFATVSSTFVNKTFTFLCIEPNKYDNKYTYEQLKEIYDSLTNEQRNKVEGVYWELSKKKDSRITGLYYGRDHFFDDLIITTRSLHRCDLLNVGDEYDGSLIKIEFTSRFKRNKTTQPTQYYSLGEKYGNDHYRGHFGYVNGMGNTIGWAGTDASKLSDSMIEGNDLHCVYLPSYQISNDNYSPANGDSIGFLMDVARHLTINSGMEYSKTSILIAQQWIDYLTDNPDKEFLQLGASDGGTFICSSIKLILQYCPHLLSRLSIILLAPGCFLIPPPQQTNNSYQILNFVKKEDHLISKLATGANYINENHPNIIIVPHNNKSDHPHNFTNIDFVNTVKPFIDNWKSTGKLIV